MKQLCGSWSFEAPAAEGMRLTTDGFFLRRSFVCRNFKAALAAINAYGDVAEDQGHHPDLSLTNYRTVTIKITTQSVGALSINDFVLAAKLDQVEGIEYSPKFLRTNLNLLPAGTRALPPAKKKTRCTENAGIPAEAAALPPTTMSTGPNAGRAPPSLTQLLGKWNKMSDNYEQNYQVWSLAGLQVLYSNLQLQPPPGGWSSDSSLGPPKAIVEVGCGPGGALERVLPQLPHGCHYAATDYSPEMLSRAKMALTASASKVRMSFSEAPASCLPFANGSFDRYVSNLTLMLVPDFDAAAKEAARVLKPGGLAAFSLWGRREKSHYFRLQSEVMSEMGVKNSAGFDKPVRDNFHVVDEGEARLRARVKEAGFDRVVVFYTCLAHGHVDGLEYALHRLATDQGGAKLRESLSDDQRKQLVEGMRCRADELIAKGEPIGLDIAIVLARRG
jgi:4a-hydroxytetrahydrobiopterin dehydratase